LLFTLVPLAELYLLLEIGELMGAGPTIALVLITGMLGAALARREGARVLRSWQESMARMQMPEEGVLSGVLVLVGGVLLVTPGVITDAVGLSLLFPPTRRLFAKVVKRWAEKRFEVRTLQMGQMGQMGQGMPPGFGTGFGPGFGDPADAREDVIDVEARSADRE
jgi:UPF0716 protein FxsA